MSATTKIAAGVATGYLLGRTKKLKLAFTVASLLAGQRMTAGKGSLLQQGTKLLDSSPELKELQDQIRGRLMEAARDAALSVAATRMEQMTKALQAQGKKDEGDQGDDGGTESSGSQDSSGPSQDEAPQDVDEGTSEESEDEADQGEQQPEDQGGEQQPEDHGEQQPEGQGGEQQSEDQGEQQAPAVPKKAARKRAPSAKRPAVPSARARGGGSRRSAVEKG